MLLNSKNLKMGCLFSKSNRSPTRRTTQTTTGWSWEIEDKGEVTLQEGLTPEDFIYEGKESEYLVKEEGTLCGQQFSISSCKDCDVYLCDYSDSILIDSCDSCRMFIGPVSGSVFIRNCSNCKIVIASQQLRTRDSQDCDILLHCATQPVIEDSQNIRFGCFQYFYFGLKDHFNRAHLSVFDNVWYNIHNFTPNNASFEYLPEDTTAQDMLNSLSQFSSLVGEDEEFNIEMQLEGIPRTLDPYCREFPSKTMVIVFSGYYLNALSFLETIRSQTVYNFSRQNLFYFLIKHPTKFLKFENILFLIHYEQ
eukprot:gb/GECH01007817.1/.p1 GENE.gb/GECH01007817.1/~~gb/GECH01007817.1/.p1  ORF type:complete len:308 (+),score=56.22 gb/GECH01007817.1/:1-924(+)